MSKVDDYGQRKRFNNTVKFIDETIEPVLCVCKEHPFDRELCEEFKIEYRHIKNDLDFNTNYHQETTLFCFDVIEFLMNPLNFLINHLGCEVIYISYQYNPFTFFWSPLHFVQYPKRSFEKLIEKAGYEIVKSKRIWFENFSLKGIRPILKALTSSRYYYKLRVIRDEA